MFKNKGRRFFKHYQQLDSACCGAASLRMIVTHYGKGYSFDLLRRRYEFTREGVNMFGIAKAAESIGFRTLGAKHSFKELVKSSLPAVIHWNQHHFVVFYGVKKSRKREMLYL